MAFEAFYRRTRPEALRTVVFVLNDRDLAVDAVDEATARAYERWDGLSESANITGWVIRVAVNFGRADLDGDGSDVVVVVAERITDALLQPPPGDYSVVFLRQVVDGAIKTTVIEGHVTEPGTGA